MCLPEKEEAKIKYLEYTEEQLHLIKEKYGKLDDSIAIKQHHGLAMMDTVECITKKSNMFNESYNLSAALEGLFHDIGRFRQYLLSGTLGDKESEIFTRFKDHGQFGSHILLENNGVLLRYFLGENSNYDFIFTEIIKEHTSIKNTNYIYEISKLSSEFKDYSFEEIINSKDETKKNKLIALKLKILQEADSLELLQNIINGYWNPILNNNYINDEVWEDFINFRYIDMKKYKESSIWTNNCGFLLRYGLLTTNVNFVATLKQFIYADGFNKLWDRSLLSLTQNMVDLNSIDPKILLANDYIRESVKNLIESSPDGVLITEESRELAKMKTLSMFNFN